MKVAVIQMNSTPDKSANLEQAIRLANEAARAEAKFLLFPETFNFRSEGNPIDLETVAESVSGPSIVLMQAIASAHKLWILAGSIAEKSDQEQKYYNTSVLIDPQGQNQAIYRKMHLYDAVLAQATMQESKHYLSGSQPVLGTVDTTTVGLSICYDLRFPELYRHYSSKGAMALCAPSSFTTPTGKKHWEVLLRARAIENQCYVLAPNQSGIGAGRVPTWGNSMIVNPEGVILARASEMGAEILYADLDFEELSALRQSFPCLQHRRF